MCSEMDKQGKGIMGNIPYTVYLGKWEVYDDIYIFLYAFFSIPPLFYSIGTFLPICVFSLFAVYRILSPTKRYTILKKVYDLTI